MLENLVYPKLLWCNLTIEIWLVLHQVTMFLVQTISRKDLKFYFKNPQRLYAEPNIIYLEDIVRTLWRHREINLMI